MSPDVIASIVFGAVGFLFVLANLGLFGKILRGSNPSYAAKEIPYECGEIPVGDAWSRFNPRFFLLAIVFVIFDVEIAFLFPWGVAFKESGSFAFFEMLVFLFILLVGYVWFWKIGELRWILPRETAT
ncbi:MAG: NADH-quinone oxidoreductase subunit A, partial [Candidatus Hydrogenedentota bacterium]